MNITMKDSILTTTRAVVMNNDAKYSNCEKEYYDWCCLKSHKNANVIADSTSNSLIINTIFKEILSYFDNFQPLIPLTTNH